MQAEIDAKLTVLHAPTFDNQLVLTKLRKSIRCSWLLYILNDIRNLLVGGKLSLVRLSEGLK